MTYKEVRKIVSVRNQRGNYLTNKKRNFDMTEDIDLSAGYQIVMLGGRDCMHDVKLWDIFED